MIQPSANPLLLLLIVACGKIRVVSPIRTAAVDVGRTSRPELNERRSRGGSARGGEVTLGGHTLRESHVGGSLSVSH